MFPNTNGIVCAAVLLAVWITTSSEAFIQQCFAPRLPTTALAFGIPSFLTPKKEDEPDKKGAVPKAQMKEKTVGMKGLIQLITAGAGAPFLGDFEGVDKETGKFMFSLEANNLVDENGQSKQTKMPYFENGWVDPEDEAKAAKRKAEGFKMPWQK